MHRIVGFIFAIILTGIISITSYSEGLDPHYKFSGVKAPDNPYHNTWGAFQTNFFSGSFGYNLKIEVPPGINGLSPGLIISYNSQSAKGKTGWVGAGWDILLNYIQRDIEYSRKDISDDTFDLFLQGAKHDLVDVSQAGTTYRTKIDSYIKIEKKTGAPNDQGEYWLATTKDGTEYRFGYNLDSENLVRTSDTSFTAYVWRWSLDRIKDSNGNCIYFTYMEDRGSVYLNKIEYNNERKRVVDFVLENKPDAYLIIEQGSEVMDAYRLKEVKISIDGEFVRRYLLNYTVNAIGAKSLLTSITQYGSDGSSALPPVKFEYKVMGQGFDEGVTWDTDGDKVIRKTDSGANDIIGDTFDVNGDGLPDMVRYYEEEKDRWEVWYNTGHDFKSSSVHWHIPPKWAIRNCDIPIENEQSPNTKTAPMDFNRDGYIDFLRADGDGTLELELNTGSNFSGAPTWNLPFSAYIRDVQRPGDGKAPNVKQIFLDLNGDGLPDLVRSENENSWHIWWNTGSEFKDNGSAWPVQQSDAWIEDFTRSDHVETELAPYDINGDGLVDIVDAHDDTWKMYINSGSNFIYAGGWNPGISDNINDTDDDGRVDRDLIDINGDGLPDIVNPRADSSIWDIQFNTGQGFTSKMTWAIPSSVSQLEYTRNLDDNGNTNRDVFDLDGDGYVDLVRQLDSEWKIYKNKSGQADLLSKITDTLGGTISITYAPSISYNNTRLPFNLWTVKSLTTNNGMSGPHTISAATTYSYANGLYDFPSREFRGFGQVTETKADSTKVMHYYHQDEAKKGKEYRTDTIDDSGKLFAKTVNTWSEQSENNVYVSNLSETDDYTHDGDADNPKTIRQEYMNYDLFGNVGLQITYGDIDESGDEVYTYNEYLPPCAEGTWIADRIKHSYITSASDGPRLRDSFFWYDNQNTCAQKGNLTKERHWLRNGNNSITTYKYDLFGNRIATTDPEGRTTKIEYDTAYSTFPEMTTNAKGQVTTRSFTPATGNVRQETNPNGYTTSYEYDVFYRKFKEIRPYDSSEFPTTSLEYAINGTAPGYVIVSKRESAGDPGTLDTIQSIDGFGSLMQTKTEYETSANMIATDVYYDIMGRVSKQSNPYLTDNFYGYSAPGAGIPTTSYLYDAIGRPIRIVKPDNTQISRVFDHWRVTETDENGHTKSYLFDASQRLKQVVENNLGDSYTTAYTYNPLGELIGIVDNPGNVTTIKYDTLGRKTMMIDPDMGMWKYSYDGVSNLISQTDARGVETKFQYDPLDRKVVIDYPNDPDVHFTYDTETIGTLYQVEDASGTVIYKYDQRLRKIKEVRSIDNLHWTTKWSYDSLDRISGMTYPDNQSIALIYNTQGKLKNIPGILTNLGYNAAGQTIDKQYANDVSTTYSYNSLNHRLKQISSPGIQDLNYTYDSIGNIKSIVDAIEGRTEIFDYDDLDRLTSAGDDSYSRQYQYNAIGNMTSVTKDGQSSIYTYGENGGGPHAVTGMTGQLPIVGSFVINNGDAVTTTNKVTLNNVSFGNPTHYMASEDSNFAGCIWQVYSQNPVVLLSGEFGIKTIYLKVRNDDGISEVKDDLIYFQLDQADATIDSDGDGLTNKQEYEFGTDADRSDTDSDGLTDYQEVLTYHTNPIAPDSDYDGLKDSQDPNPNDIYHEMVSQHYSIWSGNFNEGGNIRGGGTLTIPADAIGNNFALLPFAADNNLEDAVNYLKILSGSTPAIGHFPDDIDADARTGLQEAIWKLQQEASQEK